MHNCTHAISTQWQQQAWWIVPQNKKVALKEIGGHLDITEQAEFIFNEA